MKNMPDLRGADVDVLLRHVPEGHSKEIIKAFLRRAIAASTFATPDELRTILGPVWTICRKTPKNVERYGNCITRKQYEAATKEALARRGRA